MDLRPLRRHRDYRALYAAQFVSFLGSMVTYVALPYQMFKLTGSSLAVGQASVVSGGVLCVLGVLLCGALLPRFVAYDARAQPAAGGSAGGDVSAKP